MNAILFPVLILLALPAWLAVYGWLTRTTRNRSTGRAGHGKAGAERRGSATEMHELKRQQTASHWLER